MSNRKIIIDYVTKNPFATIREIQEALSISSSSVVFHHLCKLREDGLIGHHAPKAIIRAKKRKDLLLESLKEIKRELQFAIDEITEWEKK